MWFLLSLCVFLSTDVFAQNKKIVYLVSDIGIPFWRIISQGLEEKAKSLGYDSIVYTANNEKQKELQNLFNAIDSQPDAMVISPINSSTAQTILKFANKSNIPVVIADIGTQGGEYLSYISSDNFQGASKIAEVLVEKLKEKGWLTNPSIGIIGIPQKRLNGKLRTAGFLDILHKNNIKDVQLYQQVDFSYDETYNYTLQLIEEKPNLKAIWLQGSDRYQAALDAINKKNKNDQVLLLCFDAEPEFIQLIKEKKIVGFAMQQPYLIGERSAEIIDDYFHKKSIDKQIHLDVLAISKKNLAEKLDLVKKYALGIK